MTTPTEDPSQTPIPVARVIGPALPLFRAPVVPLALVAFNVAMAGVFFLLSAHRGGPDRWLIGNDAAGYALGEKVPSLIHHGEYWRLVTASFLHESWEHLLFNMAGLLVLGIWVEAFYGKARTFVILILTSVGGTAASYVLTPSVSLGASTGVLGLLGALIVHNALYARFLPARMNANYFLLPVLAGVQILHDYSQPQVDRWAHIGGLVCGMALGCVLASRLLGTHQRERDWLPLPTAMLTACGVLIYGFAGLAASLPHERDLLQAARARHRTGEIAGLERTLERRPYFVEARLDLADDLASEGDDDAASAQYKLALRGNPGYGYITARLENLSKTDMDHARQHDGRGEFLNAAEDYRRAARYAQKPDERAEACNDYAWTLADKLDQNLDAAEKSVEEALAVKPKEPAFIDTLAWVYYKQGRYPEALRQQLRAVRGIQGYPNAEAAELYYHLGAIYEKSGREQDAVTNYTQALKMRPVYPAAAAGLKRLTGSDQPAPSRSAEPSPRADPAIRHDIL